MRYLPLACVVPGMILGRTVYGSNGNVLLTAGTTLTARYIVRLKQLGYPALYIRSAGEDDDFTLVEPVRMATRLRAQSVLQRLAAQVSVGGLSSDGLSEVSASVTALLDEVTGNQDVLINALEVRSFDAYTFGHSVNTCILSLLAGLNLGLSRADLLNLGVGALLHDLGKIFVPSEILNKPGSLTAEEFSQVKSHPERGYHLLRDRFSPLAAHVAYQHHERCDGTGYPRGLQANETVFLAKIVAVADSLDAMTSDRVYSRAMVPHKATEVLRAEAPRRYDPDCVKAVTQVIAPYTLGTVVRLDTGEVGEVVGATRHHTTVRVTEGRRRGETLTCPDDGTIVAADEYYPLP
ncbi:MAG: HD-GYP domain-containing protein [Chitinophagales bacterium]